MRTLLRRPKLVLALLLVLGLLAWWEDLIPDFGSQGDGIPAEFTQAKRNPHAIAIYLTFSGYVSVNLKVDNHQETITRKSPAYRVVGVTPGQTVYISVTAAKESDTPYIPRHVTLSTYHVWGFSNRERGLCDYDDGDRTAINWCHVPTYPQY